MIVYTCWHITFPYSPPPLSIDISRCGNSNILSLFWCSNIGHLIGRIVLLFESGFLWLLGRSGFFPSYWTILHYFMFFVYHLCCLPPLGLLWQNTTDWVAINKKNLLLTVLDAGKVKIKAPTRLCSFVRALFLVYSWHLLAVSSKGWRAGNLFGASFIQTLTLFMRIPLS